MNSKDYFKEGCGCDKKKDEMSSTGDVAGFSMPLEVDDEDEKNNMKKVREILEQIEEILNETDNGET